MERKWLFTVVLVILVIGSILVIQKAKVPAPVISEVKVVNQNAVKQESPSETVYVVKKGDTLWTISKKFSVPIEEIAKLNGISVDKVLQIGDKLRIPVKSEANIGKQAMGDKAPQIQGGIVYQVKQGDSLWTIARKFGVKVEEIAGVNNIGLNKPLQIGEKLRIPHKGKLEIAKTQSPIKTAPPQNGLTYQVKKGDSLWTIARRYGVSAEKIAKANNISLNKTLQIGEKLVIPGKGTSLRVANSPSRNATKEKRYASSKALKGSEAGIGSHSVIKTALSYQGARYAYGGLSSRGFDCSGFVKYVYQKHGINLPHNAAAQFGYGKPVGKGELKPGDLVFFRTGRSRGINHVGIYIGNGKFIHASSARGRVRVDSLNEGYYKARFAGARRLK